MKTSLYFLLWIAITIALSYVTSWTIGLLSPILFLPFFRFPIWKSILLGFAVGFISWGGTALYLDQANQHQLAGMIANLLKVDTGIKVILLTALLGGLGISLSSWMMAVLFRPYKLIH